MKILHLDVLLLKYMVSFWVGYCYEFFVINDSEISMNVYISKIDLNFLFLFIEIFGARAEFVKLGQVKTYFD